MAKPKTEIEEKSYYRDIYFLYEALNTLENIEEVKLFVKDIFTRSELRMFKRRWHIGQLLHQGLDVRTVANKSKTSSATVIKIKKVLEEGNGGLLLAIERTTVKIKSEKNGKNAKKSHGGSKYVKGWVR